MSDFPDNLKLTTGGAGAEGTFLGFATVSIVTKSQPTVRFDHCGMPLRMFVPREYVGLVQNEQQVIIRYDPQDQFIARLWTLEDINKALSPRTETSHA